MACGVFQSAFVLLRKHFIEIFWFIPLADRVSIFLTFCDFEPNRHISRILNLSVYWSLIDY